MKQLFDIGRFVRKLRVRMRTGTLSRAPAELLRLEYRGDMVECDWIARPADSWDADLPVHVRQRNVSWQALEDALAVRELLFCLLPDVQSAVFRVYRQSEDGRPELIITGTATEQDRPRQSIRSLPMRAKLCGFHFWLNDGTLDTLPSADSDSNQP